MNVTLRSRDGGASTLDVRTVEAFSREVQGQLIKPGEPDYDSARAIWNAMIDRRPGMIVRCRNADDVARTVRFCAENELLLAVRGGGHNITGNACCEGGVLLDLSAMRSVRIDPERKTARVGGGATLGDFDAAAQEHGLATPLGINSTTGVGGLTLGGGFGWLSRRWGLAADNLLSADLVTADGKKITASASNEADLFWGIRGGGGNFGVVTDFEFRLHEVGPAVLAGLIIHRLADARDVLRQYREFQARIPEECSAWFVLRKAPPFPFLPEAWHGREILALAICYSGEVHEGEEVLAPIRKYGSPLADIIQPMPYVAWQQILDPALTPGKRNYWKSHNFRELSDGLIDALIAQVERIPDPECEIAFAQLGGAVERVAPDATAYTARDARLVLNVHGRWSEASQDEGCIQWARDIYKATSPFATRGAYVNFLTGDEQDRVREAYGSNYERLVQLKNRFDPTNLFRMNQNIEPRIPG